jgi:mercuric ion transport protein
MTTDSHGRTEIRRRTGDTARTVIAAGGLLAAFGVASCCALPVGLSMLGIGAASLVGIGYLAAPWQRELFWLAILCLAVVALLSWRQWQARASGSCAVAPSRLKTFASFVTVASVASAVALIALTLWIEGPV